MFGRLITACTGVAGPCRALPRGSAAALAAAGLCFVPSRAASNKHPAHFNAAIKEARARRHHTNPDRGRRGHPPPEKASDRLAGASPTGHRHPPARALRGVVHHDKGKGPAAARGRVRRDALRRPVHGQVRPLDHAQRARLQRLAAGSRRRPCRRLEVGGRRADREFGRGADDRRAEAVRGGAQGRRAARASARRARPPHPRRRGRRRAANPPGRTRRRPGGAAAPAARRAAPRRAEALPAARFGRGAPHVAMDAGRRRRRVRSDCCRRSAHPKCERVP